MAWLQIDPSGNFHVSFRFGGKKFKRSLRSMDERHAFARKSRLEESIQLVNSGRLVIPLNADIPVFLLSDGALKQKPRFIAPDTLVALFDAYIEALPNGSLEHTTIHGMQIHRRHLERHFGPKYIVQRLSLDDLQQYVAKRSRENGLRGRTVGAVTIKKEIVTFRTMWNWAVNAGKLEGVFPKKGLRLPKGIEKPPFQTLSEVERQIERGGLTTPEKSDLWDAVFLCLEDLDALLAYVKNTANQPFIYPMFVMAAHTGARRSELMRSELNDIGDQSITIRERKRVRGKQSTRRVPMSAVLREAMEEWLRYHPGGKHTFCQRDVFRSKNRRREPRPVTPNEANDHFKRSLRGTRWEQLRGWHVFRHSFCSNCAMKEVDQRVIDAWVGHTTDAMRRRYRHLFPNAELQELNKVFQ